MTTIITEVYDAFRAGGTPDAEARKAAEALAAYENRFVNMERDLTLLKWMVGVNTGLTLLVIGKLFS